MKNEVKIYKNERRVPKFSILKAILTKQRRKMRARAGRSTSSNLSKNADFYRKIRKSSGIRWFWLKINKFRQFLPFKNAIFCNFLLQKTPQFRTYYYVSRRYFLSRFQWGAVVRQAGC